MMKLRWLWIFMMLVVVSGCTGIQDAWHTVYKEPHQYSPRTNDRAVRKMLRDAANEHWSHVIQSPPQHPMMTHPDYELGFKEGFADYLEAGGSGMPPAVPPRRYWSVKRRGPDGHFPITAWTAGFEHGAQVAMASGLRQFVTIPYTGLVDSVAAASPHLVVPGAAFEGGLPAGVPSIQQAPAAAPPQAPIPLPRRLPPPPTLENPNWTFNHSGWRQSTPPSFPPTAYPVDPRRGSFVGMPANQPMQPRYGNGVTAPTQPSQTIPFTNTLPAVIRRPGDLSVPVFPNPISPRAPQHVQSRMAPPLSYPSVLHPHSSRGLTNPMISHPAQGPIIKIP